MNRDAYLNPGAVIAFASTADNILNDQIEACRQGSAAFNGAAGLMSFQGRAADAIKAQFQDFLEVFDLYISSANLVQSEIAALNSRVGDEILDGAVITEGIDNFEKACREHTNDSIAYREMAERITEPSMLACRSYLNHVADIYEALAENDRRIARQWREKARAYDQVEGSTAGLFGTSTAVLRKAVEGIGVISGAYQNGLYDAACISKWKGELSKVIYDSYRSVEQDGSFSVNWTAVEASLRKPADHITDVEYGALAVLYTVMAPKDMGRFLGLLTNQSADVDQYRNRLSAYAGDHIYEDYKEWTFDQEKLAHIAAGVYYEKEAHLSAAIEVNKRAVDMEDPAAREKLFDEADQLLAGRSDLFKRYLILNLCTDLGTVRSGYADEEPRLTVETDMHGQYVFSWQNEGNVGQRLGTGKDIYSETASYTAEISTYDGLFMSMYGDTIINDTLLKQVSRSTLGSVVYDFSNDQIKSEMKGAVMKELAKKVSKEWVSDLPVIDVLEIPFSLYSEYKKTAVYLDAAGNSLKLSELSDIYGAFDFEGGYVCVHGDEDTWMMQYQEGVRSRSLIDEINAAYIQDTNLTIESFKNEPDEVVEALRELMAEGNDLDRIKIDHILSGGYR